MLRKINVTGLEIGYVKLTSFSSLALGLGALRPLATPLGLRSSAFSPSAFLPTALHSWEYNLGPIPDVPIWNFQDDSFHSRHFLCFLS